MPATLGVCGVRRRERARDDDAVEYTGSDRTRNSWRSRKAEIWGIQEYLNQQYNQRNLRREKGVEF
jgi:hypothetical protein